MVFCDQSLGGLYLDALSKGPPLLEFGAHADRTGGGFDFDYTTRLYAQAFRYQYNTLPESLSFSGIHLTGGAAGVADDPADPATWSFNLFAGINGYVQVSISR